MRTFPPSSGTPKPAPTTAAVQSAANGSALGQIVSTVTPAVSVQPSFPQHQAPEQVAAQVPAQQSQAALPPGVAANLASQIQALSLPQVAVAAPIAVPQPAQALPLPGMMGDISQQFQFLSTLASSGLPPEQIAQVVAALGLPGPPPPPAPGATGQPSVAPPQGYNGSSMPQAPPAGDQYDYKRPRTRSRSPDYKRRRVTPPNRRESPVYGVYDPEEAQHQLTRGSDFDRRGRGRGRDRGHRRSPPGRQVERPPSPRQEYGGGPMQPKYIRFEEGLPKGTIKVLSRTLFVGGVAATEREIRDIFSRFGNVQTCIVNLDKRHAFVKMVNRQDALTAKAGMEVIKDPDVLNKARSTRWGVGFGPRECSDYATGVSVVPISALTDADKRWLLTAEYGGTGGRPLEPGMVVEEPDIEIGAGVSSKGTPPTNLCRTKSTLANLICSNLSPH